MRTLLFRDRLCLRWRTPYALRAFFLHALCACVVLRKHNPINVCDYVVHILAVNFCVMCPSVSDRERFSCSRYSSYHCCILYLLPYMTSVCQCVIMIKRTTSQ